MVVSDCFSKQALRERVRSDGRFLVNSSDFIKESSRSICEKIKIAISTSKIRIRTIGAFISLFDEPKLQFLTKENSEFNWVYPRVKNDQMEFIKPTTDHFKKSNLGIDEPESGQVINRSEIDLLLVPGQVFNNKGSRIGRGKGFYDRYLSQFSNLKWGVCFDYQLLDLEWHLDPWDQKVQTVVTESRFMKVKESTWK